MGGIHVGCRVGNTFPLPITILPTNGHGIVVKLDRHVHVFHLSTVIGLT